MPLDDLARRASDAPALREGARVLSYRDLDRTVARACGQLVARGVRAGDRVLVVLPNSIDYVVALLAIARAGAIAVPVPPVTGAERLAHVVGATEPRLVIDAAMQLDAAPVELPSADPDAPAIVLFSSGSTGITVFVISIPSGALSSPWRHAGLSWM